MLRSFFLCLSLVLASIVLSQSNIIVTNPAAENVLKGIYNPNDYTSAMPISGKDQILSQIISQVNSDSLKSYLFQMSEFGTRNTASDTTSSTTGIGAARNWAHTKFEEFSQINENRLEVSFLEFDQLICAMDKHKNIFAVLPGTNVLNHEVIFIEGHIDSRCDDACDILCEALGMEDNASGSALVLELARVMSALTFDRTIVFLLTIGEEQGLFGANAFSQYCVDNEIPVKAVFNNDVVGGVLCGQTSSAPSCPGLDDVDSTNVRIFSAGMNNSPHKQLARYTKLEYKEEGLPIAIVPMGIHIMSGEDRVGRGGDHIPFRQDGFNAIRTCSANEHGDAGVGPGYTDRQHTIEDILGIDTSGDGEIDSFFVDFNYLGRNAIINGIAAAMAANSPSTPTFNIPISTDSTVTIDIIDPAQYGEYRIALRTNSNDWDTVYTTNSLTTIVDIPQSIWYHFSVASVDIEGIESLFGDEQMILQSWLSLVEEKDNDDGIQLMQNKPNPFDESTTISVYATKDYDKYGSIVIRDLDGQIIEKLTITLKEGTNEVLYNHGYGISGVYSYSLLVDNQIIDTKRMIFAF